MQNEEKQKDEESTQAQSKEITLPFSGQRTLTHYETPPAAAPGKHIHPRRPLPLVPQAPPETEQNEQEKIPE